MRVSPNTPVISRTSSAVLSDKPASVARVLNEQGRAYIDRWVVANATQPAKQSLPAWHHYAEVMANQSIDPSEWVIEMAMSQTKSGYPEELCCPAQWFAAPEAH